jgi:hypothetical protein
MGDRSRTGSLTTAGLAAVMATGGCVAPALPPVHGVVETRPPITQCAAVRDIDWRRFDPWASRFGPERTTPEAERAGITARLRAELDPIGVFETPHRPSPEALIVIRAYVPPAGHHAATEYYGMTWREPDGRWWVWSQSINRLEPPAPPPPPWEPQPGPQTWDTRFPPVSGPVPAESATRLEAAWADPCRAWEPDQTPYALPLLRRDPVTRSRLRECPDGGAPVIGEITEKGQQPRLISYPCNMAFSTDRLLTITAFAKPAAEPSEAMTTTGETPGDGAEGPF